MMQKLSPQQTKDGDAIKCGIGDGEEVREDLSLQVLRLRGHQISEGGSRQGGIWICLHTTQSMCQSSRCQHTGGRGCLKA